MITVSIQSNPHNIILILITFINNNIIIIVEEQDDDLTQDLTARNKRRKCLLCGIKAPKVHPMNVYLLSRFVSPHGTLIIHIM